VTPEDFRVEELLGFAPDGSGAHLLLHVEKRGANSGWVAAALARAAQVATRDVGMSGYKDRDAVTRQYYSLPASAAVPAGGWTGFEGEGFRVLEATPHGRKLRTGTHRANRCRIAIRGVSGDAEAIVRRLQDIERGGVPNYFGPQRFGRDGANLRVATHGPAADRHRGRAPIEASRCPRRGAHSSTRSWPGACGRAAGSGS
jgi:tRNA pseudouridine13 synthase